MTRREGRGDQSGKGCDLTQCASLLVSLWCEQGSPDLKYITTFPSSIISLLCSDKSSKAYKMDNGVNTLIMDTIPHTEDNVELEKPAATTAMAGNIFDIWGTFFTKIYAILSRNTHFQEHLKNFIIK